MKKIGRPVIYELVTAPDDLESVQNLDKDLASSTQQTDRGGPKFTQM